MSASASPPSPYAVVAPSGGDDTSRVQAALTAAAAAGGKRVVQLLGKTYLFTGTLTIPSGVTLRGTYEWLPRHETAIGQGDPAPDADGQGTCLLTTQGSGSDSGTPFITVTGPNAYLIGVSIKHPNQNNPNATPTAYPYTVAITGRGCSVQNVEFYNSYQAIDLTSSGGGHLIRNCGGQALYRGIKIDNQVDTNRIENVHWIPVWTHSDGLGGVTTAEAWVAANAIAFEILRCDDTKLLNCLCYRYYCGAIFYPNGGAVPNAPWCSLTQCSFDVCNFPLLVQGTQPAYAVSVVGGTFTAYLGSVNTPIKQTGGNLSVAHATLISTGPQVDLSGGVLTLVGGRLGDIASSTSGASVAATGGSLICHGVNFGDAGRATQVSLGASVAKALVRDNITAAASFTVTNAMSGGYSVGDNL